jgi:GNAT superfamily N-acetyltransferase
VELQRSDACVLSDDPSRVDLDVVHRFLTTAYWSTGVSRHTVARAIAGSVVMGAYARDGRQVGFARAVTDRATFAWLADVFVLPAHRGRGIARAMVTALLEHPDLQGLRRWMLATADAHALYAALGFDAPDHPDRLMERRQPGAPPGAV